MTSPETIAEAAREDIDRWRRRSRVVHALRIAVPAVIFLILLGLAASVAYNAMKPGPEAAQESNQPIRLINPRFVGRDDRGRAFALTAASAARDPQEYQKVYLDHPALVIDEQGPNPMRITATRGVFHETTGKLEVSGGVRLASNSGAFDSAASQFDTKTGELVGSGPIKGSGPLGEIDARSYGVYERGDRMVFDGRVHTRLVPK